MTELTRLVGESQAYSLNNATKDICAKEDAVLIIRDVVSAGVSDVSEAS